MIIIQNIRIGSDKLLPKKITFDNIKNFIENESECILLTSEQEFINKVCTLDKFILSLKCKCGTLFKVDYKRFKYTNKRQCNKCSIKIGAENRKLTYEEIKNFIEIESNTGYKLLSEKYVGSQDKLLLQCSNGHTYKSSWSNFKSVGSRCPTCKDSNGELAVLKFLEDNCIKYIKQHRFDYCKNKYALPFDFYLPGLNVCIEYDGKQHFESVYSEESFKLTKQNDKIKNKYCKENNIPLLRIPYWKFNDIENILTSWLQTQFKKIFPESDKLIVATSEDKEGASEVMYVEFQNGNRYELDLFKSQEEKMEIVDEILNNPDNANCIEIYWETNKTKTILDILSTYIYNGDGSRLEREEKEYSVLSHRQMMTRNGEVEIPVNFNSIEEIEKLIYTHKSKGKKAIKKYKNSKIHKLLTLKIPPDKRVNRVIEDESKIQKHIWQIIDEKIVYKCEKDKLIKIDVFTDSDRKLPFVPQNINGEWVTVWNDNTFCFDNQCFLVKGIYEHDKILCFKLDNKKNLFFTPDIKQVKDFSKHTYK